MIRTLNRYFHWTKPFDNFTHGDIAEAIDAIEAKSEAVHAFKNIRAFFNWCVPRDLPHSPCDGLKPPSRYIPRSRVLSNDELRKVWYATGDDIYGTTVRLRILTGQRLGETAAIQKEWLDGTILTIPSAFTKNNREHTEYPSRTRQFPSSTNSALLSRGVNAKSSSTKEAVCPASRTMIFAGLMRQIFKCSAHA